MSEQIKKQNEVVKQEVKGALTGVKKDIADQIFNRVNQLESNRQLIFPANYAVGNALKSAYLILQDTKDKNGKNALQTCTPHSVANALLDMVIQGLNPVKKQCYFIAYGNQLQLFRSYFGDQVAVKNALGQDVQVAATVIYKDDEVKIGFDAFGFQVVESHKTSFENRDKPIVGAYATIITANGEKFQEVMTKKEIDMSWSKAKTTNVQRDFPQEMAKRTVIRRLCKRFLNTSSDANLFVVESYNKTTEDEYIEDYVETQDALDYQVDAVANQEELVIEEGEVVEEEPQTVDEPSF